MRIYHKILIGFGVIILLMITVNVYMLWKLNGVSIATQVTFTADVSSIQVVRHLESLMNEQERDAQKFLVSGDTAYFRLFREGLPEFDRLIDSLMTLRPSERAVEMIHKIRQSHAWLAASIAERRYGAPGARGIAWDAVSRTISDTLQDIQSSLEGISRINQSSIDASMALVERTTERSAGVASILAVGSLLAAVILAIMIAGTITEPIDILIRGTQKIARGSFEPIAVPSHDEIAELARAVNDMSDKLRKISELKAEMMQQISHELRTPLSTILGAHYLLASDRTGQLTGEQQRLLDIIRRSVDKLTEFSHQFLDLAKIEAGMMEYHFVRCDLAQLLEPTLENARVSASRKRINILVEAEPAPQIMADPEKLSIVFANLLSNAIKYTDDGGTITVNIGRGEMGTRASVRDTGIGIPGSDLPKLFTRFYQAGNSAQVKAIGTGLGLAIVKAFVEGHHGTVSVSSAVNEGTTFTIDFPGAAEPVVDTTLKEQV